MLVYKTTDTDFVHLIQNVAIVSDLDTDFNIPSSSDFLLDRCHSRFISNVGLKLCMYFLSAFKITLLPFTYLCSTYLHVFMLCWWSSLLWDSGKRLYSLCTLFVFKGEDRG